MAKTKTRASLSDITILLDRSGSMAAIKDDAQGGLDTFVEQQKKEPGKARLTLYQFDNEYELVYEAQPLSKVKKHRIEPRGTTALLDAMGRSITEVRERLRKAKPKPDHVFFVTLTDGHENFSVEWTKQRVLDLVKEMQGQHKWNFIYLAADEQGINEALAVGVRMSAAAAYSRSDPLGCSKAMTGVSQSVSRVRSGEDSEAQLTEEDREQMGSPSSSST